MDLNDLFYRQQIARSTADAASSESVRRVHEALAKRYEMQIAEAAKGLQPDREVCLLFDWCVPEDDVFASSKVNPTLAVALTAREVGTSQRQA